MIGAFHIRCCPLVMMMMLMSTRRQAPKRPNRTLWNWNLLTGDMARGMWLYLAALDCGGPRCHLCPYGAPPVSGKPS
jgi:hypothetical protein